MLTRKANTVAAGGGAYIAGYDQLFFYDKEGYAYTTWVISLGAFAFAPIDIHAEYVINWASVIGGDY